METRFNLVIGKVLSDPVWIEKAFRYLPLGPTLQDIVLSHGRRIYTQDQGRLVLRWNNEPFGSSDAENYVFLPLRNCKIVTRELDRLISIASDTALALPCVRSKPSKAQSTLSLLDAQVGFRRALLSKHTCHAFISIFYFL